ncbi:MAG: DNA recombination protein RmuC [Phycisphaerales bacterium]|nr:MAG: DNA recombination protein RmuC [Phycisphaerales bacterium]
MEILAVVFGLAAVAGFGAAAWLWAERARLRRDVARAGEEHARLAAGLERAAGEARTAQEEAIALRERLGAFERREHEERERLATLQKQFQDTFDALASRALRSSNEEFMKLAKQTFATEQEKARGDLEARRKAVEDLVKPIGETLRKTDEKITQIDRARAEAFASLQEQLRFTNEASVSLRNTTSELVNALRKPQVRGRYGEVQLERVVELAGMRDYCDFSTQTSARDDEGRLLRPDMIVRLPNDRVIAIDAKTNIDAYLDAMHAANPEEQEAHLARFARHVFDQAQALSRKDYWKQFDGAHEFVVMFIPGDQFIDAALQRQPRLLDVAMEQGVILASPSTLIGLMRAVAVGWREKRLSDSAQELFGLGRELHARAQVMFGHVTGVGQSINQLLGRYNQLVGSIDSRLVPTLRRFEEQGASSGTAIKALDQVDGAARTLQSGTESPTENPETI